MNMPNMQQIGSIVQAMITKDPSIANDPHKKAMIQAIMNGDEAAGIKMADGICNANGINRQEAYQRATQWASGTFGK